MSEETNIKKIFWKFWRANHHWNGRKWFGLHFAPDQIEGVIYSGVTIFGISFLYSDHW